MLYFWLLFFLIVLLVLVPRIPKEASERAETEAQKDIDPLDQRINQAVAMVEGGENPMQGIMMLRDILEEHPEKIVVHWHLAHFSVQSGQYDKAAERFEKVIALDAENQFPDAAFYLGKTLATLNRNEEAIQVFDRYLEGVQDTTVKERVEEFIEELKALTD